jgi:Ser/Thr protein kinase RdoA (MazF antagonist)
MVESDTSYEQKLSTLQELAQSATRAYALPPHLHVKLINLSENATYKVEAEDGRCWALRIHREGYHSKAAIASELHWLLNLRSIGGIATPRPVKGRNGEIIQTIGNSMLPRSRHIVMFEWEDGVEPGIAQDLRGPFEELGALTARMHVFTRQWERPVWFTRFTWDFDTALGEDQPHWGHWRDGLGVDGHRVQLFERTAALICRRLAAYGKGPDRFGLIHSDLRLANLLVDNSNIKVIDFDDCGFGWHMYDAATPVSFHEHETQVPDLIESWKNGYRRVIDLAKVDEAEIPTFMMMRRLLLVAWIGSHKETDLAKSMGPAYTEGTVALCENYLRDY